MEVTRLRIEGAFLFAPAIHADDRGDFLEWFKGDLFEQTTGRPFHLAQSNASTSRAGTIRGVHFAEIPPGQAKYVMCGRGEAWDVVVDIRLGSPTYGQWEAVRLDDRSRKALYLSEGLGHAFMALVDDTLVTYLCSAPYAPGREHGVNPFDSELAIEWPTTDLDGRRLAHVLSPKDEAAPTLAEAAATGMLPTVEEAEGWKRSLQEQRSTDQ